MTAFDRQDFRLKGAERRYAASFIFAGVKYPCACGPVMQGDPLGPGGFSPSLDRVVVVRKSVLPKGSIFRSGQSFSVMDESGTTNLKIKSLGIEDLVSAWQLTGEAQAQGV